MLEIIVIPRSKIKNKFLKVRSILQKQICKCNFLSHPVMKLFCMTKCNSLCYTRNQIIEDSSICMGAVSSLRKRIKERVYANMTHAALRRKLKARGKAENQDLEYILMLRIFTEVFVS